MLQYALSWDSYKSNICSGFSSLQQNGEFVDMTIAADGHFVKVHQVLLALASPYLKGLISSASSQHPVIFLNNVSHKVLSFLLEYIYTGEVVVPSELLAEVMATAKSLHIRGLEGITDVNIVNESNLNSFGGQEPEPAHKRIAAKRKALTPIELPDQCASLPSSARKIIVTSDRQSQNLKPDQNLEYQLQQSQDSTSQDFDSDYKDEPITTEVRQTDVSHTDDSQTDVSQTDISQADASNVEKLKTTNLLFTVSIRGSLQVILNRYIYNLNSSTAKGLRRWRCVEYRDGKCTAFLVTKGNMVVNRANPHTHPFHDGKILAKIEKKAVFTALEEVEVYREKEKQDLEMDIEEIDKEAIQTRKAK